jgi:dienelactone hydrolase
MMKYATNRPLLRRRARCGFDELRKVPNTDLSKLAAIGYCFGGMAVLEMARDGQNDLAGIVSFPWRTGDADAAQIGNLQGEDFSAARSQRSGCAGRPDVGVLERDARRQG